MARPVKFPTPFSPNLPQIQDNQATRIVSYLSNCRGINKRITTEQMTPDDASELENFFFNEAGKLQTRGGTLTLGTNPSANIIHVALYQRGDKRKFVVRWLPNTVEYFYAGVWTAFTGAALGFGTNQRVYHAAWGTNNVVFVGNSKVWSLDFMAFTVTEIAASPANSQQVYVFGNRVIVCAPGTNYTRVQWSVKNDNTDWSGDGSGFEDIIPGPSGYGDTVLGGFAVSDTEALVVRTNSVWLQTISGDLDAPFSFRYLYSVSIKDVTSAAGAPGGVYCLGNSDVYFLSTGGPESLGDPIKNKYIEDVGNIYGATQTDPAGAWDEYRKCYYLSIPVNISSNTGEILVYHRVKNGWTTFKYPVTVNRICASNSPKDFNSPESYFTRGPIITRLGTISSQVIYEDPNTTTDVTTNSTQPMVAFATMGALQSKEWGRRVKFESLTLDINGGTQIQLTASVTLFAPSRFNDVIFETINISSNVFIATQRLRQRQTFFGVRERNGIVPKITLTESPLVSLNSCDIAYCDGSQFLPTTVTSTPERCTVDLVNRTLVDGSERRVV